MAAVAAIAAPCAVFAAPPPAPPPPPPVNPGAIGSGLIQRGQSLEAPGSNAQAPSPSPGQAVSARPRTEAGASFILRAVEFGPSRFLSAAELQGLARPFIGKQVSIEDLRTIVAAVNALYAKHHVLTARAFLPAQKVHDGIVKIDLVEGRLGKLKVVANGYTSAHYVEKNLHITAGETVDIGDIRQDITTFNRNNDAQLSASLQPGSRPGLTDLTIAVTDPPRNAIQLFADTYGYESTGRYEGGMFFRHSDLLTSGDRATLYLVGSGGSITGNAAYNLPLFGDQGRLGVSYARSNIEVTSGVGTAVKTRGSSDTWALNYGRPLFGGDSWGVALLTSASWARSQDNVAGTVVETSVVGKGTAGISIFAEVGTLGRFTADAMASGAGVDHVVAGFGPDKFFEFNGDFEFRSTPVGRTTFRLSGAGQFINAGNVPGSQLFQIGGPMSIRGYATGVGTGVSGYYVNGEVHHYFLPFKIPLDAYGFVDYGQVFSRTLGNRSLTGAGLGFEAPIRKWVDLQVIYGHGFDRHNGQDRIEARLLLSF